MVKIIKPIFLIVFGSVTWLVSMISLPIYQASEDAGFVVHIVRPGVHSAYAGSGLTSSAPAVACVSLIRLESREQEDVDAEHDDADDEHHDADKEHKKASIAHLAGDYVSELAHENKAAEHELKAIEHETKATEYEEKVVKIRSVTGNCSVFVVAGGTLVRNADGTPKTESGVWIPVNVYQSIADMLAQRGGAGVLFDSVASGGGSLAAGGSINIINPMPDSTMLSYREIRAE